eukprot:scaffold181434_cov31-Tisochrysis_lutea.AAC.5
MRPRIDRPCGQNGEIDGAQPAEAKDGAAYAARSDVLTSGQGNEAAREWRERQEIVFIRNGKLCIIGAYARRSRYRPYRLHRCARLHRMWIETTIGLHEPIDAECLIAWGAGWSEVPPVGKATLAA